MQLRRHLVTASYVDNSMSVLDAKARSVGITILGEMGLDPGIGNATSEYMNDTLQDPFLFDIVSSSVCCYSSFKLHIFYTHFS